MNRTNERNIDTLGGHDRELHPLGWRKVTAAPALEEALSGLGPTDHEDVATHHDVHGVDPGDISLGVEDRGKGFVGRIERGGERARVVSTARACGDGRLLWRGVLLGKTIVPAGGGLLAGCRGGRQEVDGGVWRTEGDKEGLRTVRHLWGGDDHDLPQFLLVLNRRGNGPGQRGDHHGSAKNGEEVVHESGHFVVIVCLLEVRRVSIGGQGPAAEGGEG